MIYLMLIDKPVKGTCVISGKPVHFEGFFGFFENQNLKRPVLQELALEKGFTVTPATLDTFRALIDEGRKYEEVQESAHHEIKVLEEDS
ncbi:MAG: hypothetical protein P8107_08540 [Spirochaetia bacterium]|jgi:hypothetical protein